MEREDYEAIVNDAIAALPAPMQERLAEVAIVIDERPTPRRGKLLLGLYEGIPLTEWGRDQASAPPDKITLFTQAIEESVPTDEEVPDAVRETLWHEIAYFFGFEHDKIGKMERRWQERRD